MSLKLYNKTLRNWKKSKCFY